MYNQDGDVMITKIERLDHQGRGIAKINDKITFIPKCLPGEVVDVSITLDKKKYMEARLNKVIEKSPSRIDVDCPYFELCGGCQLRHMSYEDELKYKENKVKDIFKKYATFDTKINEVVGTNIDRYRNKIVFQVDKKIGFFEEKTNKLIPIEKCLLISDEMNEVLKDISIDNINQITIREGNELMVFDNYYNKLLDTNDSIISNIGDVKYKVSQKSFFQINKNQTVNLYNKVLEYASLKGSENVLDLYCGIGSIGLFLANKAKHVLGVEINSSSIEDANYNAKLNNITNTEFILGDTKKVLSDNSFKADVVVVDPPRSGLDKEVVNDLLKINPDKIVYVSCDPITLVRDLNLLNVNYNIKEVSLFDMFPRTYHIESVVLLERK